MPFDNTPVEPAVKVDPVIETLTGMRELIAKGWIQGHYQNRYGRCLVGAFRDAHCRGVTFSEVFYAMRFGNEGDAVRFNDNTGRTKQDVLDRIDWAIENRKKQL